MTLQTLDQLNPSQKTIVVRADLNVPLGGGQVIDKTRIEKVLPTLNFLRKHKAKIIILSHLGRPKGRVQNSLSLTPIAHCLSHLLGGLSVPVIPMEKVADHMAKLSFGDMILMENVRFHPGEETNDPEFSKKLGALGDIFVNDAFSVSHRAHASVEGITHFLPSYGGFQLVEEVTSLSLALKNPRRPLTALVAGAKVSTKLGLLENLSQTVDTLIIGGGLAHTFLAAQGFGVGKDSLCEEAMIPLAKKILQTSHAQIIVPRDVNVSKVVEPGQIPHNVSVTDIPSDQIIVDMGEETLSLVTKILSQSGTLVWNGAVGIFEVPPFHLGTHKIARTVATLTEKGTLFSVAGGGETVAALNKAHVQSSLSYVSLAGGAFLEFLEGKKLPGLTALGI